MTSVDIFNHLGWKGPFTPDYVYRVFLGLQLCTDGTVLTTLMKKELASMRVAVNRD